MSICARCTAPATLVVFGGQKYRSVVCDRHVAAEVRLLIQAKKFNRRNAQCKVEVWEV